MDRLKTYVEGFDEALGGGIPRGSLVLVAGTPGTMKTALTFSILYENVKAGSKALYITLEESQEDLRAAMTDLGMTGLDDMELYILDVVRRRVPRGRDPVPGAGRERRRRRAAAPPMREDAPRAARARILRAEPERRPLPDHPRDVRVRSSGAA